MDNTTIPEIIEAKDWKRLSGLLDAADPEPRRIVAGWPLLGTEARQALLATANALSAATLSKEARR